MGLVLRVTGSGGDLLFEADPTEADLIEIGAADRTKDIIKDAATTVDTVAGTIRRCARQLVPAIRELAEDRRDAGSLSHAEIEIGLKLSAEGNIIVVKGTAEAHIKVSLNWDFR